MRYYNHPGVRYQCYVCTLHNHECDAAKKTECDLCWNLELAELLGLLKDMRVRSAEDHYFGDRGGFHGWAQIKVALDEFWRQLETFCQGNIPDSESWNARERVLNIALAAFDVAHDLFPPDVTKQLLAAKKTFKEAPPDVPV